MTPVRVLLAEDHVLVRAGIRSLLQDAEGIAVIAETGDGRATLTLIAEHRPDLVLMDISMPELGGLEAAARVRKEFPGVRVVMLSMYANEEYVIRALSIGALGYVLKDADPAELVLAIKTAMRGETYLSRAVSKNVFTDYLSSIDAEQSLLELLTPRQREILQRIAEGHSSQEIAQMLNISIRTVEAHRAQLMERLDIRNVAGLVRYAIRKGLVAPA